MTGLEPIIALGLVCNILQLVELGRETIDCIKTVYQEGKLDEKLEQHAVALENLTNQVNKESRPGNKRHEAILLRSAASCFTAARDLQEELRFLFGDAKRGSLVSAVKVTAIVKWRQRRLERLRRSLDMEEKRLQSGLLAQVWSSTNAANIDTCGVRRELRFFIEQYRQGHRETTDLLFLEGLKARELVSREAERTNQAVVLVEQKLDCLMLRQRVQMNDQIREQFLKSLAYPDFNQRRAQIHIAHGDTFKWIFVGDNDDDPGEDHNPWSVTETGGGLGGEPDWSTGPDTEAGQFGSTTLQRSYRDQQLFSKIKWDSFSNWLRSSHAIYWINGKPGSGKTTLTKYILADQRTRRYLNIWSPGCEIASHFFWRPGSPMQKNLEGLFCSLLYQLLGNNDAALREVISSLSGPKHSFTDWSSTELRLALMTTLHCCKNGVCLFLDGLDEIDPEDGTKEGISELMELVSELTQTHKIKFCLASRPNPHILEMRLSVHPQLRLQDLNYADLMAYAKERVKYPQMKISEDNYDPIHFLVNKAEGVFLWLLLAIKSINEGISYHDSTETLRERINRLPKGLDSLYEDMWARAGGDSPSEYRQTAALYFKLLLAPRGRTSSARKSSTVWECGFDRGANVFDLMLATTSVADGVLDALDEPSKLICPNVMRKRCQEVERKLKIYCVGLVEVRTEDPLDMREAAILSWYGHTYDGVWPVATSPALQFLHRTARDFLIDTEPGRKILDCDTSSGFTVHYQLMKALLARLALFAGSGSSGRWADELRRMREIWESTTDWVSKDWDRLVLICERLAHSGRLYAHGFTSEIPYGGTDFLRLLTKQKSGDEIIISRLKSANLSKNEMSTVLLSLSDSQIRLSLLEDEFQARLCIFRALLRAGADPNWQAQERLREDLRPPASLRTPWQSYLLSLMIYLSKVDIVETSWTEFASVAGVVLDFILQGAKLDDMIDIFMLWNDKTVSWSAEEAWISRRPGNGVLASIPAHLIVEFLAGILRLHSRSNEESCLERCVGLERACASHSSSKLCRVFGKLRFEAQSHEFVLYETTDEMQKKLGDRLIESLRMQLSLTKSVIERRKMDMSLLILNDETWVVKAREEDAMWKWLEELELLKFADERPETEGWIRIRGQGPREAHNLGEVHK